VAEEIEEGLTETAGSSEGAVMGGWSEKVPSGPRASVIVACGEMAGGPWAFD